jgi:hypothetical protein
MRLAAPPADGLNLFGARINLHSDTIVEAGNDTAWKSPVGTGPQVTPGY